METLSPSLSEVALYGLAGDFVRSVEPHTESSRSALLFQFLTAFGCLAGRNAYFQIEASKHYPNLFLAVVGKSARGRKGTSWSHVESLFDRVDADAIANCQYSGMSSGEGLIASVCDPLEDERTDGERKIPLWVDKRRLVVETEFGGTLRILKREGNTLSAILRKAWDCGSFKVMTRSNPLNAKDAHISVIGHITASELQRHLSDVELFNGFANRFMWVFTERSKKLHLGGDSTNATEPLIAPLRASLKFAGSRERILMTSQAEEKWKFIYDQLDKDRVGILDNVTSRAEPIVLRLSLIFALLDQSKLIDEKHLDAALAAWDYCDETCLLLFGDAVPKHHNKLINALKSENGITRTEISRGVYGGNKSSSEIEQIIKSFGSSIEFLPTEPPRFRLRANSEQIENQF